MKESVTIKTPAHVFDYLGEVVKYMPKEEFYMICLNSKSQVITSKLIAKGTHNQVSFNLQEVTSTALKTSASGVILVHNHPSGTNKPSPEDIALTKRIYLALALNGIYVMDHLVIAMEDYYSFNKNGLFDVFNNELKGMFDVNALRQKAPEYNV